MIKSRHGGLPSEADLQGAGRTILRLIDTYGIDIDQLMDTHLGNQLELSALIGSVCLWIDNVMLIKRSRL